MTFRTNPFLCKQCAETDPSKFYKGRKSLCKSCDNERAKQRYHSLSRDAKQHYKDNANKKYREWVKENTLQYRLLSARNRAKYKNIEFSITIEHLEALWEQQEGKCFYTGVNMVNCNEGDLSVSIDRVDSTKGYTEDNTVLCAWKINVMKNDQSLSQLLEYAQLLIKHNS